MNITVRKFTLSDVKHKVDWINNPVNNKFLHYDLPLEVDKTCRWFAQIEKSDTRYDAVIEVDSIPVGLIGLLSIDRKNKKAEYYVCLGELAYRGQGVTTQASEILLNYAFMNIMLNRVYLFTEEKNIAAQSLFKRLGFQVEGLLREDIVRHGTHENRYLMSILRSNYLVSRGISID